MTKGKMKAPDDLETSVKAALEETRALTLTVNALFERMHLLKAQFVEHFPAVVRIVESADAGGAVDQRTLSWVRGLAAAFEKLNLGDVPDHVASGGTAAHSTEE